MTVEQWKKIFASRLRSSIENSGMESKEVAIRANISPAAISRYLNGDQVPSASTATSLAHALRVDVDYLVDFDEVVK